MSQTNKSGNHKSAAKVLAALMVLVSHGVANADEAAQVGREGQAFGQHLSDSFQFPTEGSNGSIDLGAGEVISPSDMAPNGSGFYIQNPNVDGLKSIYDSEESMYDVGRDSQNKLWEDAQAQGNPFDPNPSKRNEPGPSTISGSIYQVVLGAREARGKVPDLTNDPIVNSAADHITNSDLLESFGDCSVESEVVESSRPVHVPDLEYCERIIKPASGRCQVKHEIILEEIVEQRGGVYSKSDTGRSYSGGFSNTSVQLIYEDYEAGVRRHRMTSSFPTSVYNEVCGGGDSPDIQFKWVFARPNKARVVSYTEPSCDNNLTAVVIVSSQQHKYMSYTMTIDTGYTKKYMKIKEDRWYPEECVARAQKS